MKTTIASIAAAVALTVASASAFATDNVGSGKVTFNGKVTGASCTISVNNDGNDATVELAPIGQGEFTGLTPAKVTDFSIKLTNCDVSDRKLTLAWTEATLENGKYLQNSVTDNGAKNVHLALLKGSTVIVPGVTAADVATDVGDTATFDYSVGYVTTGSPKAGAVSSSAVYTVVYE